MKSPWGRKSLLVACLLGVELIVGAVEPGHVYYQRLAAPDLDRWTNLPDAHIQQWFRGHFFRMGVFSPYFDLRTSWYPSALVYRNLYGISTDSVVYSKHPDWVLHDPSGRPLYIPWNCNGTSCPQYAGDIANPAFRAWWISEARSTLSRGYLGLWIDDVNMEFRVSDGTGKQVIPIEGATGQPMGWTAWRNHVADFVEQIRAAFPKAEIVHNSIWFAGPEGIRDADSAIRRQIAAADDLNIERGIASDPGLNGGTGKWSVHALFDYVDRVHQAGKGVTLEEYVLDSSRREYALAAYFLISSGNDRFGDASANPANWWKGYDVDLGKPLGPRAYSNGIYRRNFSHGLVMLAEPRLQSQNILLPGAFMTLDGRIVRSVTLSDRQGIILTPHN
jgi:hypothetical protein